MDYLEFGIFVLQGIYLNDVMLHGNCYGIGFTGRVVSVAKAELLFFYRKYY